MEYISVSDFARLHEVSERTVRNYCATGKIEGAFLTGKTWNIPADATLPRRGKAYVSPLLKTLREQKQMRLTGSIYHRTQIDLTYNSNHIEGSRLTHDQTRYIFETNTIGVTTESVNVDDIIETSNHFRCIDLIIDRAEERLTEGFIKELHGMLKNGTSASPATALASSVLPVPGGPTRSAPLGILPPRSVYRWGFLRNSTISCTSSFAPSCPATSAKVMPV